jgi:hypothetical protein
MTLRNELSVNRKRSGVSPHVALADAISWDSCASF